MSEHPPTILIVYLCPAHNEDALSHLDEALTVAGIEYRLIAQKLERRQVHTSHIVFLTQHSDTRDAERR